jgi:mono/diheme cytochrome c family protein
MAVEQERGNRSAGGSWVRRVAGALAVVAVVAVVATISWTVGHSNAPPMTKIQKIARGKQLSYASGCIDCHTPGTFYGLPDTTRMMSGSELGWEGPWGVTYPRNLTPDRETGIGSWTEEQIVAAFRTGIRPDKSPILPPMPWPAYAHMNDQDAYALAAYLKSLPPIRHHAPERIPPGGKVAGARLTFPPPPAWDGQHLPPAMASSASAH